MVAAQLHIESRPGEIADLVLTGGDLTTEVIARFVRDADIEVSIDAEALARVRAAEDYLKGEIDNNVVYGINTGFGPMASHLIGRSQLLNLQSNLIRSHAAGMGEPVAGEYVLAAMLVRLNTLAKGYSGVSEQLLVQLQQLINHRILPLVPEHGAVGTSGDLVQLAHIALALIGEGRVMHAGTVCAPAEVFAQLGLAPHRLQIKEGLALINGTAMMTGIAALLVDTTEQLLSVALRNSALALELVGAYRDGICGALQALRPHEGQRLVASVMRDLLYGSQCLRVRKEQLTGHNGFAEDVKCIPDSVQEVYSLRCTPQILGPVYEALQTARRIVDVEMNSVTDNPIVHPAERDVLHGGNFHGDYIAYAVDQLKMTLVKLTMLAERRIGFFLNAKSNGSFPPFLNLDKPGLTLGLQGMQFVATSTAAQSQTLAFPQYVHSISTNADNQDLVSMGTDAALLAMKVARNASTVLAIEAVTLAQAVDFLGNGSRLAPASREHFDWIRELLPAVREDRTLAPELEVLEQHLQRDEGLRIALQGYES